MPKKGHNSGDAVAADRLRAFVSRIERLEEEKAAMAADIREIYAEARGDGFDTKVLRQVIARRKKDAAELQEQDALLELYLSALGEFVSTPLGEATIRGVTKKPLMEHVADTLEKEGYKRTGQNSWEVPADKVKIGRAHV